MCLGPDSTGPFASVPAIDLHLYPLPSDVLDVKQLWVNSPVCAAQQSECAARDES